METDRLRSQSACRKRSMKMPLGFKKAYKALYIPTNQPSRRTLPTYHWIAMRHRGIPKTKAAEAMRLSDCWTALRSQSRGSTKAAAISSMSCRRKALAAGGSAELDCAYKKNAVFISVIRLPDFITKTDFECAKTKEARKKLDFSAAFFAYEGIRCLRIRTL